MRRGPRPMIAIVVALVVIGFVAVDRATTARAAGAPAVKLTPIAPLELGTAIAPRPGDAGIYITEQTGTVRVVRGGKLSARPLLDITADVSQNGGEQGLLGLAFSPDGDRLYLDYTDRTGTTQVVEYAMRGRSIVTASRRVVLTVDQPQVNHNGGQLAFGPDGMLYIALGDGGGAGDRGTGHAEGGNAQSLGSLLGKILRIDPLPSATSSYTVPLDNPFVGHAGARPEIWAYGLRNPWRFTFDARTGDLWIGDVGQNAWEEIDRAPAVGGRDAGRGDNFGWNRLEGTHFFTGTPAASSETPVAEYSHGDGSCSVVGGYVYRGRAIPALQGMYVFTDYCVGELRALEARADGSYQSVDLGITSESVATFGEQHNGELFVLSQTKGLYRIDRA
jgi:glucose/arabinose dehydrogenase